MYCRRVLLYLWRRTWLVNDAAGNEQGRAHSLLIVILEKDKGIEVVLFLIRCRYRMNGVPATARPGRESRSVNRLGRAGREVKTKQCQT